MQSDDRAMTRIEALQRTVDQLAVGEGARRIGRRRRIERTDLDFDRTPPPPTSEVEAGVHGEPVEPSVKSMRITETTQVPPGADECLLDRVARELRVSKDQSGCRVQPREGRVDESGEGVMIAPLRAFDELSLVHGRLEMCHDHDGRARQGMASPSRE